MLGVLCSRHRPWILNYLAQFSHAGNHHHHHTPIHLADKNRQRRLLYHSTACQFGANGGVGCGGVASIWHAILPSGGGDTECPRPKRRRLPESKGEGSWNVAWDARPARWLHKPDSAWLLFGVRACLAPIELVVDGNEETSAVDEKTDGRDSLGSRLEERDACTAPDYKVTGMLADGRCLFRAIVHGACLSRGEEAPDGNRQRELADELRAQVVEELLKRREETEWFIEGDFDAYVKEIQQPYVWGGEPEMLMASHVLQTSISVFTRGGSSRNFVSIANYGQEYRQNNESTINLLFHGYGHYELLENLQEEGRKKVNQ